MLFEAVRWAQESVLLVCEHSSTVSCDKSFALSENVAPKRHTMDN
jgi:hypothetical protein